MGFALLYGHLAPHIGHAGFRQGRGMGVFLGYADPAVIRQGGDTIMDAVPLAIPTVDLAGTTVGYTDDYDEVCPMSPFMRAGYTAQDPTVVEALDPV